MENEFNREEEDLFSEELSFSDKFTGVITAPAATFQSIAKFELKTSDWLLPIVIMLAAAALFTILKFTDAQVAEDMWNNQKSQTIEQLKKENKSAEQIKQFEDAMEQQKKMMSGPIGYVFIGVPIFIGGFIIFFISSGIYLLLAKLILKSPMNYKGIMIIYALPALISVGGMVISTIATLVMSQMINDTSLASFLQIDKGPLKSYLAVVDPLKLWAAYISGIGMAKLSNSENTNKYIAFSIGVLVAFYVILGTLSLAFPGLQNFGL